ncbi:hypothetical protein FOA52_013973 [Chlamydomonas sp. UWO 241]|nr:hypothetical protein FOA52_013973 [Chlamydomonas sp. UWO 241]
MPPEAQAASDKEVEDAAEEPWGEDRGWPDRVTKKRAKLVYHVNDDDLARLSPPQLTPNLHYASAAPMQLYDVPEVKAAAKAKAAAKEAADRAKPELMRQKKATEREHAAQAAKEAVGAHASDSAQQQRARKRGLDEVRDELVAARDVATVARACRDMRLAAQTALVALGGMLTARLEACKVACAPFENGMAVVADVQALVTPPAALPVPRLKAACRALGLHVGGTKPVLILRALEELRVAAPSVCAPPAVLLLEAWRQRRERPLHVTYDGMEQPSLEGQSRPPGDEALSTLVARLTPRPGSMPHFSPPADATVWKLRRDLLAQFGGAGGLRRRIAELEAQAKAAAAAAATAAATAAAAAAAAAADRAARAASVAAAAEDAAAVAAAELAAIATAEARAAT